MGYCALVCNGDVSKPDENNLLLITKEASLCYFYPVRLLLKWSWLLTICFCCRRLSLFSLSLLVGTDIQVSISRTWLYPRHVTFAFYSYVIISDIQQATPPPPDWLKNWSYQWMSDILWEVVETWSEWCFSPPTQSHSSGLLKRTKAAGEPISLLRLVCALQVFFFCLSFHRVPIVRIVPIFGLCLYSTTVSRSSALFDCRWCQTELQNERGATQDFYFVKLSTALLTSRRQEDGNVRTRGGREGEEEK